MTSGLERLRQANSDAKRIMDEAAGIARADRNRRAALVDSAQSTFKEFSDKMRISIQDCGPHIRLVPSKLHEWHITLGLSTLTLHKIESEKSGNPFKIPDCPFSVVAFSAISLDTRVDNKNQRRCHSLWYCDAQEESCFGWFETAFMHYDKMNGNFAKYPFYLEPNAGYLGVKWATQPNAYEVVWPFTEIDQSTSSGVIDRWASWLADAATGNMHPPTTMPERPVEGSWRTH